MSRMSRRSSLRARGAVLLWLLLGSASFGRAQVCDPPGPPPRFACQWSTSTCEWICPVCDPFGPAPRPSCTWDSDACNWRCDGYTGVDVTVRTVQPPSQAATVFVKLSSLCTATGVHAACGGSFTVHPGMTVTQKCQSLAGAVAASCASAGYAVTMNDCAIDALFTASNVDCPGTAFALGVSNSSSAFDQTWQGALPDGELESTTGRSASCAPIPGPVAGLRVAKSGGELRLNWDDATAAHDYVVFEDTAANGAVSTVVGTAPDGAQGLTLAMPQGREFFLVAGRNDACGVGPKR